MHKLAILTAWMMLALVTRPLAADDDLPPPTEDGAAASPAPPAADPPDTSKADPVRDLLGISKAEFFKALTPDEAQKAEIEKLLAAFQEELQALRNPPEGSPKADDKAVDKSRKGTLGRIAKLLGDDQKSKLKELLGDRVPEASGGGRENGRDERRREAKAKVGETAPDWTLEDLSGNKVTLSSFREKKPVVLIFGSYT